MTALSLPCPSCSGTHEDRHAGTRMDVCRTCKDTGTIPARTGETPEASFDPATAVKPVRLRLTELKERSEHALGILQTHFPESLYGEVFAAEEGENYHGLLVACDCPETSTSNEHGCSRCVHPLAGTPMIGGMTGYYEPEWDEETTYELLAKVIRWTDKPDSMTEADWVGALAIVGMTTASHAKGLADFEREATEIDLPNAPTSADPAPARDGVGR